MDRRTFLKLAGIGGATAGVGSAAMRVSSWWRQTSAAGFEVLSGTEVEIVRAMADAMFPGEEHTEDGLPNGAEAGVVEHLDQYLAAIDARSGNLLRMLIHLIDEAALVSDLRFRRFRYRPREQRIAILKAWDNSSIVFRRKAFRGLKIVLAGGYCNDPKVLAAAGIDYKCGGTA